MKPIFKNEKDIKSILEKLNSFCGGYWSNSESMYHPYVLTKILVDLPYESSFTSEIFPRSVNNFMILQLDSFRKDDRIN